MRPLVAAVFGLALAATVLAGDGLVLVPHMHAWDTPDQHAHGPALYRFPIALLGIPADAPQRSATPSGDLSFRLATPAGETLAGVALLLLVGLAAVTLAAPTCRTGRAAVLLAQPAPQWSPAAPTGPPRLTLRSVLTRPT